MGADGRQAELPRRKAHLTLDELVAGVLLLYPSYYDWQTGGVLPQGGGCLLPSAPAGPMLRMRERVWTRPASAARSFLRRRWAVDTLSLSTRGRTVPFFPTAQGRALARRGDTVRCRVNVAAWAATSVDWPWPHTRLFRKKPAGLERIGGLPELMDKEQVTDLHVFGDWRPLHREAVLLAKVRGHVRFGPVREGYLRPDYITMEQGGVNGLSSLPDTREGMAELAARCPDVPEARKVGNPQTVKTWRAIARYPEPSFSGRFSGTFRHTAHKAPAGKSGAGFCVC